MKNNFSILDHYFVFKKLLIRVILVFMLGLLSLFFWNNLIYEFFSDPLIEGLQISHGEVIATQLISTFIVPLKLTILSTFYLIYPYLILEVWFFIKPGLYKSERIFAKNLLVISTTLIYFAFFFCFYIAFPGIINFFINFAPQGLSLKIDINYYLELLINLIFAFSVAFQIPIVVMALVKFKIIKRQKIQNGRPYIYVISFILAAVLTPPDVLSQIFLALPMIFLFESGLLLSKFLTKD